MSVRGDDGGVSEGWSGSDLKVFEASVPWRTFRWRHGQRHYSGTYWSATMRAHVVYESRLELTRLLYADFDPDVTAVYAQPFLLCAAVDGKDCRHVPDFLVLREGRVPLVVDVKPRHLLTRPRVAFGLGWAREVVVSKGWDFEVWCEPPAEELSNLRFLAGYRRGWLFDAEVLAEVRGSDLDGATLGEAFGAFPHRPAWQVRAAVLRLLWSQDFTTDLGVPLSARHVVRRGRAVVIGAGMSEVPGPAVRPLDGDDDGDGDDGETGSAGASAMGGRMGGAGVRVGVGTRLRYDGEVVVVEEMFSAATGNELLVRDGLGRRLRVSLREVLSGGRAAVIGEGGGPASDEPRETASVLLAQLGEEELARVRERAAHLHEVLCGYRSGTAELAAPGEPRAPYAPTVPRMRRYEAKAAELEVSVRTVKRWVRSFLEDGVAGLVTGARERSADSGGLGRADPRWVEMALEIMAEHGDESKPTRAKVIRSVGPRLAARHGAGEVPLPTRATAYRWLAELECRLPTFRLSTKRNRDIAARPGTAYGKLRPTRPGEYLLMDTNRLDVFALDELTLEWVQPELTIAMDWYDRCVVGLRVTPVSTKSVDVAATLFQVFRPRPAGADWPAEAVWPEHGIPRTVLLDRMLLDPDAVEATTTSAAGGDRPSGSATARPGTAGPGTTGAGTAGPALVPETIVIDHGKVFVSEHLTSVCQRLGISIQPARLRTGRDKGPIERYFRTLREGLLESLPGYKGPDLFSRGLDPEGGAFFFLHELEAIITEWTAVVFHHRPQGGLVDPRVPGLRLSPAAMFEHGVARAGYIEVPRDPDLGFEFLKTEWRPIHHYGVEIRKCRYDGPGLDGFRNQTSTYTGRARGRWPIQVDPDDITRVYFRHPTTRRWHTLMWEHAPALRFPISEEALELARRLAATKYKFPDDERAVAELLQRWNLGLGTGMAERRIALRLARQQTGTDLPATDEVRALPSVARVLAMTSAAAPAATTATTTATTSATTSGLKPSGAGDDDADEDDDDGQDQDAGRLAYEGLAPGDDDEDDDQDDDELAGPDAGAGFYADALEDA